MHKYNLKEFIHQIEYRMEYHKIAKVNDHMFNIIKMDSGTFPFQVHQNSDELFLVLEGTVRVEFSKENLTLHKGDFIIIPCGSVHRYVCISPVICLSVERSHTMTKGFENLAPIK